MSYRVIYEPEKQDKYPMKPKPSGGTYKIAALLLLIAIVLLLVNPVIRQPLREFLIPGDASVTGTALETMAENLRTGASFGDAVTAFCQEILENGKKIN